MTIHYSQLEIMISRSREVEKPINQNLQVFYIYYSMSSTDNTDNTDIKFNFYANLC